MSGITMHDIQLQGVYATARRQQHTVGVALCAFIALWVGFAFIFSKLFMVVQPMLNMSPTLVNFLVSDIAQYLVALPIALLVLSRVPVIPTRQFSMSLRQFAGFFAVSLPIMYAGNFIGIATSGLLTAGRGENRIAQLIGNSDPWVTTLFAVILAPIVEEFFFRKQLIDRLRLYGERRAVVFSALAFALFHMNVFQFFYAFGLGLVFGYMYMRTSRLRYSLLLHVLINFQGSVVSMWVTDHMLDVDGNVVDMQALVSQPNPTIPVDIWLIFLYSLAMLVMMIIGIVLLCRAKRYIVTYTAPLQLPNGLGTRALYSTFGVMAFIVLAFTFNVVTLFA